MATTEAPGCAIDNASGMEPIGNYGLRASLRAYMASNFPLATL